MTIIKKFKSLLGFKTKTLHESSIGRIYQHSKDSTIGMMTAFRSEFTLKENRKRNDELKSSIRSNGFGFVNLTGHYPENGVSVVEESFLIISEAEDHGKLRGFLKASGHKWNQDSVLYKEPDKQAVLIGTADGLDKNGKPRWPGLGTVVTLGDWKPNRIGDMYSKLKGKGSRSFVFESVDYEPSLFTLAYKKKYDKI